MTLPPGTILQLMYLKERLRDVPPGRFVEIGVGQGHLSACLLALGWTGVGFELDPESSRSALDRNAGAVAAGRYDVRNVDWLQSAPDTETDLLVSCMVLEHFNDQGEARYLDQCRRWLSPRGLGVLLVPGSPLDWGVEDDIAGHYRRYSRESLGTRLNALGWRVQHIAGLTFPLSNLLLPVSNALVRRAEGARQSWPMAERTMASGKREVAGKTAFPSWTGLLLNEVALYPLHLIQKLFRGASRALVLYAEFVPASR